MRLRRGMGRAAAWDGPRHGTGRGMRRAAASDEVAARVRPRAVLAGFAAENALFQQPMP
jgi:hypothetical protein